MAKTKFTTNTKSGIVYDFITIALSTLGTLTAILGPSKIDASREMGFRVLRTEYWLEYEGKTDNEGPIIFGLSVDMTVSQIANAISADPQGRDPEASEANLRAKFPIFPLKMLSEQSTESPGGGNAIISMDVAKVGWSLPEGSHLDFFAFNLGSALTTGTVIRVFAKHFGVWLDD